MGIEKLKPQRKQIRPKEISYNAAGAYFITICTKAKEKLLCNILADPITAAPVIDESETGQCVRLQLEEMADFYASVKLDRYVIMPNHIHLILLIPDGVRDEHTNRQNSVVSKFVGSFKRFSNKAAKTELWQSRYYDHVIRNEKEYLEICEYIDNNPSKWTEDGLYVPDPS